MKSYPAKLLLFGEHTVNTGSQALAVPLPAFSARWQYAPHLAKEELAARQMQLPQLAGYLGRLQRRGELLANIDVAAFEEALQEGLIFESNIPPGYGAGSSGALVAAVFGEWAKAGHGWSAGIEHIPPKKILALKQALAQMESFFHGTSSGTDPLVCFLRRPLLLGGHDAVKIVNLPNGQRTTDGHQLFLLDTGIERKATPLIEYFLGKVREEEFYDRCKTGLLPAVDGAIHAMLGGDTARLYAEMHRISDFQLRYLEKLIPAGLRNIWSEGLENDLFKLKICGAGGGGFLLGITKDFETMKTHYPETRLLPIF